MAALFSGVLTICASNTCVCRLIEIKNNRRNIHSLLYKAEDSMKVLVAVKRVVDANVKVNVLGDNSGVDLKSVKMAINPFCEMAVEEAIRL